MRPFVSVLMTTYRHEGLIDQALRSVLAQRADFPFEVVVGVDAGPDSTAERVSALANESSGTVRPILQSSRVGIFRNFADVYAAARGEVLALLEGDDYWTDDTKLQRQVDLLLMHPRMSVCGHYTRVERDGATLGTIPDRPFPECDSGLSFLQRRCDFHLSSLVFRDRFGRELPAALTDARTRAFDLGLKVLLANDAAVGFVPRQMSVFRAREGSLSSSFDRDRPGWLRAMILTLKLCRPSLRPTEQREIDRFLAREFLALSRARGVRPWSRVGAVARSALASPALARNEMARSVRQMVPSRVRAWAKRARTGRSSV